MTKVFVPRTGGRGDWSPVVSMFDEKGYEVVGSPDEADFVCFTGGSDVSPILYGEDNTSSFCDPLRDATEIGLYRNVTTLGLPIIGICRGAQFINVMEGGTLHQDISPRHSGTRKITFRDGSEYPVAEDHHQAIKDIPSHGARLAWDCSDGTTEIVEYDKNTTGLSSYRLAFQAHPEWDISGATGTLFFELLQEVGLTCAD